MPAHVSFMANQNNTQPSETARRARWHIGQRIWQWCSTNQVLLLVLTPVAFALIASYLLPQTPAHLYADKFLYQEWLSERQIEFKNWTPLLTAIGAFRIRETLWFRVLLMLLAFILLISLGEQIRRLLDPVTVRKPIPFYNSPDAVSFTSHLPCEQAIHRAKRAFRRPLVQTDGAHTTYLYAGRRTWARAGTAVVYLGVLVLASGLAIQVRSGWRQSGIQVLPYEDILLGPDKTLQLRLLDIQTVQEGDTQSAPIAHLQVAGQTVLPIQLGVPTRHRGYRYVWVSRGGPSVRLSAFRVSEPEQPLTLYDYAVRPQQAKALQFSFAPGQDSDRQFILSEDKVVGWLRWDVEGEPAGEVTPRFQLWLFGEDGQELGVETFEPIGSEQGTAVQHTVIGDVDFRLEVARHIVLDVAHQPGQPVLWLGGVVVALGGLGLAVPQNKIWAQISAMDDHVVFKMREQAQSLLKPRDREAESMIARLRDALEASHPIEIAATRLQAQDLPPEPNQTTHRNDP